MVDNDIVKKAAYNELVKKVNAIDTSGLKKKYLILPIQLLVLFLLVSKIRYRTFILLSKKQAILQKISEIEKIFYHIWL